MNNANNTPCGLIDSAKFQRLMRQYKRENPHDLPELRRNRRPRIAIKPTPSTLVYSTRTRAIA